MDIEGGGDAADLKPDPGRTFDILAAFLGSVLVVVGIPFLLFACCLQDGCRCQGVPWLIIAEIGVVVAAGCATCVVVFILQFCC